MKKIFVWMALSIMTISSAAFAGDDPIYTGVFNNKAVGGYDTVSYFQESGPVKGKKSFKTKWRGANWYFVSQENLDAFTANPEKYAPQYGGYCAWAAAHDTLAKGSPKHWSIIDDKLYLNYDKSIHEAWTPRQEELIPVADGKYPELVDLTKE